MNRLLIIITIVIVCVESVKQTIRNKGEKITQEIYHGSSKLVTSSPHTLCKIVHLSTQLSKTFGYHYIFFITPNQFVTLHI